MLPNNWKHIAKDRDMWRDKCQDGLTSFSSIYDPQATASRACRHLTFLNVNNYLLDN